MTAKELAQACELAFNSVEQLAKEAKEREKGHMETKQTGPVVSASEEKQLVACIRKYARATRAAAKCLAAQNYRDSAAWTDRAAVARQDITRWAGRLEERSAQRRGA